MSGSDTFYWNETLWVGDPSNPNIVHNPTRLDPKLIRLDPKLTQSSIFELDWVGLSGFFNYFKKSYLFTVHVTLINKTSQNSNIKH